MVLKFFDKVKNLFRPRPNFARLSERGPAALLVQSRTQQKSFLFLLEEKIGRAQIKKCEENFFAGWRALASGGGAERQSSQSGFSSKKVRILTKRHRQFSKFGFWAIIASPRLWRGETENSSCINWRKGWDSNPRGYHYPTAFREPRFQPNSATLP